MATSKKHWRYRASQSHIHRVEANLKRLEAVTLSARLKLWKKTVCADHASNIDLIFDTWARFPEFREQWIERVLGFPNGLETLIYAAPAAACTSPDLFFYLFPKKEFCTSLDAHLWIDDLPDLEHQKKMYPYLSERSSRWYQRNPDKILYLSNPSLPSMLTAYFAKPSVTHPSLRTEHSELFSAIQTAQIMYPTTDRKEILAQAKIIVRQNKKYNKLDSLNLDIFDKDDITV